MLPASQVPRLQPVPVQAPVLLFLLGLLLGFLLVHHRIVQCLFLLTMLKFASVTLPLDAGLGVPRGQLLLGFQSVPLLFRFALLS